MSLVWTFTEGVSATATADGATLRTPSGELALKLSPGLAAALASLTQGASEEQLSATVMDADGESKLPTLYYYLSRFTQKALLCRALVAEEGTVATAFPCSRNCVFDEASISNESRQVLSRFACIRREGDRLVIESPLSHARVMAEGWRSMAMISLLNSPVSVLEMVERLPQAPVELAAGFVQLLASVKMLASVGDAGLSSEETDVTLRQWEFHDLLFHSKTRLGRHSAAYGGTFPFRNSIPPLPALKPPASSRFVELARPDLEKLKESDIPFTRVLEERNSVRAYGERPISLQQLGEFLYRVQRVTRQGSGESGEYAFRVYPGGGGEYELELYVVAHDCEGLESGIYHYAPGEHRLYAVSGRTKEMEGLLGYAAAAAVRQQPPQVLLVVSARFQRVSWKYQSIAYSIVLKDVGVLYQTMYLVATAMRLAPCALGGGDADLFAAAIGSDYYAETSVGEFLLGSRPSADASPAAEASLADEARGHQAGW